MRMLLRIQMSTEKGNQLVRDGKLGATVKEIVDQVKPEAAYFTAEDGLRTGYLFVDVPQPSDIPRLAEPFFLALGAQVDLRPVMLPEDLGKAEPDLQHAGKTYR